MSATNSFGDAALDADLAAILGLDVNRSPATSARRFAFEPHLSRYRQGAKKLASVVPALAAVVAVGGAIYVMRLPSTGERIETPPAVPSLESPTIVPAVRDAAPEPVAAAGAGIDAGYIPPMAQDIPQVADTREVRPPVGTRNVARRTVRAGVSPRADAVDRPVREDALPGAVDTVSLARQPVEPFAVPVEEPSVVARLDAPPMPEPVDAQAAAARARQDSVTAIRSLRRQF